MEAGTGLLDDGLRAAGLVQAARAGNAAELVLLLDAGVDPDGLAALPHATGKIMRWSALGFAARNNQIEVVRILLDHGAIPDLPNSLGGTPLMAAAGEGYDEVVQLLLRGGANVRTQFGGNGYTALHFACVAGRAGAAEALLRAGCDHRAVDKAGLTGEGLARAAGHTAVADQVGQVVAEGPFAVLSSNAAAAGLLGTKLGLFPESSELFGLLEPEGGETMGWAVTDTPFGHVFDSLRRVYHIPRSY